MLFIIIGIIFIVIGLAVHLLKMHFLISGYNTMSKEKKEKVDIDNLARLMGIYSYANGIVLIWAGVVTRLGYEIGMGTLIAFLVLSTTYLLIKAQKYDGNIFDKNGKIQEDGRKQLTKSLGFMAVMVIFIAVLVFFSTKSLEVTFLDEGLKIHGMYGDIYPWESIDKVELIDEMPNIGLKTNGSAIGSKYKGYFTTSEYGKVKLFVDSDNPPFIYLETNEGIVVFNMNSSEKTQEVFNLVAKESGN